MNEQQFACIDIGVGVGECFICCTVFYCIVLYCIAMCFVVTIPYCYVFYCIVMS